MPLMSVTEYAALHGKDVGNIRRLIAQERIPAQKVGKQWVIDSQTPFPADGRIKSGKYLNSRKKKETDGAAPE